MEIIKDTDVRLNCDWFVISMIIGYNDFRQYCGLNRLYDFSDLKHEVSEPAVVGMLAGTYK